MSGGEFDSRVCLFSQRNIRPHVSRCCAYDFEDAICEMDAVHLLAPAATPRSNKLERWTQWLSKRTPLSVSIKPTVKPIRIERPYDMFLYVIRSPSDLFLLKSIEGWRDRGRSTVCYMEEVWRHWLEQFTQSSSPVHLLKNFDHVFINCAGSVDLLQQIIARPVHYIPPGIDTLRFHPLRPRRGIDVYYMGRRSTVTHDALMKLSNRGEIAYLFDTLSGPDVQDVRQHRTLLASTLKNTRYFIVHAAKANRQEHTLGQQEVGFRFFEGAAAGTVMVGGTPRVEMFDKCFGWPDAVVPMPYDCEPIGDLLLELDRQPERIARVRRNNMVNTLRQHDWVYRWRTILNTVGMASTSGISQREARLAQLVENTEASENQLIEVEAAMART